MLDAEIMKGFPRISRFERWRHLWLLRYGQWSRRRRGITRLVGVASYCQNCISIDSYHRLGCRCWREQQLPQEERILEWGWIMESPIQDQSFISNATILEWVKAGYHVQHPDGKRVTMEDFEGEDI